MRDRKDICCPPHLVARWLERSHTPSLRRRPAAAQRIILGRFFFLFISWKKEWATILCEARGPFWKNNDLALISLCLVLGLFYDGIQKCKKSHRGDAIWRWEREVWTYPKSLYVTFRWQLTSFYCGTIFKNKDTNNSKNQKCNYKIYIEVST